MVQKDGKIYEKDEDAPDMGSLVCVDCRNAPFGDGEVREYSGSEADAGKLPHYKDLADGSSFLASDTKAFYVYNRATDTWKK